MVVRAWHLLVVGAIAICALTALVTFVAAGHGAARETKTVAIVAAKVPDEAAQQAAAANVRAALPSIEAFYADHGSYAGATVGELRTYDPGLDPTVRLGWVESGRYCIESTVEDETASVTRPDGDIVLGAC